MLSIYPERKAIFEGLKGKESSGAEKYITETVFAPYFIHSFHPKPLLPAWDERPLI